MERRLLKRAIIVLVGALSVYVDVARAQEPEEQPFEGTELGSFEALDNRAAPGVVRYRLVAAKGERISFKMSLSLKPDRFTEERSEYTAAMGLRVSWRKPDGNMAHAIAPTACDSTNVPNRRPAVSCVWVFEAPKDPALAASDDQYTLCVEDKTSPRPRRNFEWRVVGKRVER